MSDPKVPATVNADEVSPGVTSMMRIMVRRAVNLGIFMTVAGCGLAGTLVGIKPPSDLVPAVLALIAGGPALISTALAWKAWQAQAEK
jgi:hypothetical protein